MVNFSSSLIQPTFLVVFGNAFPVAVTFGKDAINLFNILRYDLMDHPSVTTFPEGRQRLPQVLATFNTCFRRLDCPMLVK